MRTPVQEAFLSLIRNEIAGTALPDGFNVPDMDALVKLADDQDLTHLVYDALSRNGIPCTSEKAFRQYCAALWRVEQMDHELAKMSALFEENGMDFIPLKGCVMRGLYPARWMRTSSDIDILFREDQEEEAERLLTEKLGYEAGDDSAFANHGNLHSPKNRIHVEPHCMLFHEIDSDRTYVDIFRSIWERAVPDPAGQGRRYMMSDADLYAYHVAHMEKHFRNAGGCSVRGLIDLWLLDRVPSADRKGRAEMIDRCGLNKFEEGIKKLIYAWMDGKPADNEVLEQFVLEGYLYGTQERKAGLKTTKKGRIGYALERIFLPYDEIKVLYPVLEKHPCLLPLMWVRRWAKVFDKESRDRVEGQLKASRNTDAGKIREFRDISEYLGIE